MNERNETVKVGSLHYLHPRRVPWPAISNSNALNRIARNGINSDTVKNSNSPSVKLRFPTGIRSCSQSKIMRPRRTRRSIVPAKGLTNATTAKAVTKRARARVHFVKGRAKATDMRGPFRRGRRNSVSNRNISIVRRRVNDARDSQRRNRFTARYCCITARDVADNDRDIEDNITKN